MRGLGRPPPPFPTSSAGREGTTVEQRSTPGGVARVRAVHMEFVYVVERAELFPEAYPHGFQPFCEEELKTFERVLERGFFVERERAERTPAWKQIIPYTLVVRAGPGRAGPGGPELLLLRRLGGGGEARLHDKLSIGVGGHINPEDLREIGAAPPRRRSAGLLEAGTRRELAEELALEGDLTLRRVGLINDDSNPVGAVHTGLVQVAMVRGSVSIRETDSLEGHFVDLDELGRRLAEGANFESWSALLVEHVASLLPEAACATA